VLRDSYHSVDLLPPDQKHAGEREFYPLVDKFESQSRESEIYFDRRYMVSGKRNTRVHVPQWMPLTSLPEEFKLDGIRPHTARRSSGRQRVAVWQPKLSIEGKRRALLRHLASHCDAPGALSMQYSRRHLVFLADDRRPDECITMRHGRGIHQRSAAGRCQAYVSIVLGRLRSGAQQSGRRYISIDAHRLVCWLVHGPPAERGGTAENALHKCSNSRCINPAHLEWGTQQKNARRAHERRRAAHLAMLGALPFLPQAAESSSSHL